MAKGGSKKGERRGGRKKGVKNKKTAEILDKASEGGILPLDYMLQVMRDPVQDHNRRDDMAKAAAPYLHSRMPQEQQHKHQGGINVNIKHF